LVLIPAYARLDPTHSYNANLVYYTNRWVLSSQGWGYVLRNWFEIPIMIPILVFVLPESSQTIYAAITAIGIMLRG
jgi:hypothetical protein